MVSITRASELVRKLSRTKKFPDDEAGVENLARGLQHASEVAKIGAGRIIERCAEVSEWCPSDAELLTVARDIAREDGVVAGKFDSTAAASNSVAQNPLQWKPEYGEPAPFDWQKIDTAKAKRVRDRERTLLAAIKAKYPGELSWDRMAEAAKELGYPDYAKAWKNAMVGGER